MRKGLLIINLGTPDDASLSAVRRYLHQFLSDRRVISLPWPLRYLLLYAFILPFCAKKTTHAYQAIWQKEGSPLLLHSLALREALQKKLGKEVVVALGMRYGKPSLRTALSALKDCDEIVVIPLYPQYASATTGSSLEALMKITAEKTIFPSFHVIRDFYAHPTFIAAQKEIIKPFLQDHDYLLFSYHGLPEKELKPLGCETICTAACPAEYATSRACYRAQCLETSTLIAEALALNAFQYSSAFQSRLGKLPWLQPYTEATLLQLANKGVKRLAIACPSFVADCLETLEEIDIRAKALWKSMGGEYLTLIPSLNTHPTWINAIIQLSQIKS